jgi:hypothetical protein
VGPWKQLEDGLSGWLHDVFELGGDEKASQANKLQALFAV